MTSQAVTQISYSNAYTTVLSTGDVTGTHPAAGWVRIFRAGFVQIAPAVRRWVAAFEAAQAQHQRAESAARVMRVAAALQTSQPALANELVAIASRDEDAVHQKAR
jgi:hypothetical protein